MLLPPFYLSPNRLLSGWFSPTQSVKNSARRAMESRKRPTFAMQKEGEIKVESGGDPIHAIRGPEDIGTPTLKA